MVRYRRNFLPGGSYFFTVALADRRARTLVERIDDFRRSLRAAQASRPFDIDAIVVLPDHLHAIFTLPEDDADYSGRWRAIKSGFTRTIVADEPRLRPNRKGEYRLWQRRFWEHTLRDEGDFARHADYIHFNPVKHGYVKRVADWPHSSFHRFVRNGALPADWGTTDDSDIDFGEPR
ncbi:MAG: transposase [Alphaproteobacteria bacterium]